MIEGLASILRTGERIALVTVAKIAGSTPTTTGARMAVRRDGRILGTVGGGCAEAEAILAALAVLDDGWARLVCADLTGEVTPEVEAACGGTMEFVIAPWDGALLPVLEAITAASGRRETIRLVTCLEPECARGAMLVAPGAAALGAAPPGAAPPLIAWAGVSRDEALAMVQAIDEQPPGRELRALVEDLGPRPALLICGGGHVGLALSQVGNVLGFDVTVLEDRPAFAAAARFPPPIQVICAPFDATLAGWPLDQGTYVAVVTRGHRHDLDCVRRTLGRGAAYVGMIGSRRRVAAVRDLLISEGLAPEAVAALRAPIGLDIGAVTPAEIAVAIMAEVIVVRRRGGSARAGVWHDGPRGDGP